MLNQMAHSNQYNPMTSDQIDLLHGASLEILSRTGIRFFHAEAISLFKKAGADISEENRVRIPRHLVEWALKTAPRNITIYNRDLQEAMILGGDNRKTYFGVGSDCMNIYDPYTQLRRSAKLQDVVNGMRLVAGLANIDFVMSMFVPSDVPVEDYEKKQLSVMLQENIKPIILAGIKPDSTAYALKMATAIVGSDAIQKHPFIINYVNTITALKHNQEGLQRLLDAAEQNMPTIYAPGNSRGTSAPITIAGMLALGNAGQLGGLVLSQLKREGSPFILNNPNVGTIDMKTMVDLYVSPDGGPFSWDLAQYYGLPVLCSGGASDSKIFDAQAATEAMLTLFTNSSRGASLIQNIGYLDSAMTGSFELIAYCDEMIGWIKQYLKPLQIDEETLALDLIDEIGPDGDFLATAHTLKHFREDWQPKLVDRNNFQNWFKKDALTLKQRANTMVKNILETSRVDQLSDEIIKEMDDMFH